MKIPFAIRMNSNQTENTDAYSLIGSLFYKYRKSTKKKAPLRIGSNDSNISPAKCVFTDMAQRDREKGRKNSETLRKTNIFNIYL